MGKELKQTIADGLWKLQLRVNTVLAFLQEGGWGSYLLPLPHRIHMYVCVTQTVYFSVIAQWHFPCLCWLPPLDHKHPLGRGWVWLAVSSTFCARDEPAWAALAPCL